MKNHSTKVLRQSTPSMRSPSDPIVDAFMQALERAWNEDPESARFLVALAPLHEGALDELPFKAAAAPVFEFRGRLLRQLGRPVLATATEEIVGCGGNNAALVGCQIAWRYASASDQGPALMVSRGVGGQFVLFLTDVAVDTGIHVLIFRVLGNLLPYTLGGVTSNSETASYRRKLIKRAWCSRNPSYAFSGGNPSNTLTLGRNAASAVEYSGSRVYEILLDTQSWTDQQVEIYEAYAGAKYKLPGLV